MRWYIGEGQGAELLLGGAASVHHDNLPSFLPVRFSAKTHELFSVRPGHYTPGARLRC